MTILPLLSCLGNSKDTDTDTNTDTGLADCGLMMDHAKKEATYDIQSEQDIRDGQACFEQYYPQFSDYTLVFNMTADIVSQSIEIGVSNKYYAMKIMGNDHTLTGELAITQNVEPLAIEDLTIDSSHQLSGFAIYIWGGDLSLSNVNIIGASIVADINFHDSLFFENISIKDITGSTQTAHSPILISNADNVTVEGLTIRNVITPSAINISALGEIDLSGLRIEDSSFTEATIRLKSAGDTTIDNLYCADLDSNYLFMDYARFGLNVSPTFTVRNITLVNLTGLEWIFLVSISSEERLKIYNGVVKDSPVNSGFLMNGSISGESNNYIEYFTFENEPLHLAELAEGSIEVQRGTLQFIENNGFEYELDYTTSGGDVTVGNPDDSYAEYRGALTGRGEPVLRTQSD